MCMLSVCYLSIMCGMEVIFCLHQIDIDNVLRTLNKKNYAPCLFSCGIPSRRDFFYPFPDMFFKRKIIFKASGSNNIQMCNEMFHVMIICNTCMDIRKEIHAHYK